jgi:hypothetical protein
MIEIDLRTFLASRTEVTDLIGTAPPRMFPVKLPQKARRPAITYRRVNGGHTHTLMGQAGSAAPIINVTAWADDYDTAKDLAFAIRDNMQGFKGPVGTAQVRGVTCVNEEDLYDDPTDGSDAGIFNVSLDFGVSYTEITKLTEK